MSESAGEDQVNFTFSQTDNSPMGVSGISNLLHKTNDFNIDLSKTFREPLNKFLTQKNIVPRRSSQDLLESDESLGILPDLIRDDMTLDPFKTELGFSDDEIEDGINPEINESPASFVFSPPSDSQFNRISLFLNNISTPLPNIGNYHRYSSTPKYHLPSNTADTEPDSYPGFLPDEKEEPIAGSCLVKFETDFDLDELKNVKPLTSTYKTFSLPRSESLLNDKTIIKSEVNLRKKPETVENLNVTQTFSRNVEDLFPCEHEGNIQNRNILNDTFEIKQPVYVESPNAVVSYSIPSTIKISQTGTNNLSEKDKVKTLDSTFAIIDNKIGYDVDCDETFVSNFNSSNSIYKDKMLNETRVLENDLIEFSSKEQEQIANKTFTKDLENGAQTNMEHPYYGSHGTAFGPLKQILEETFPGNNLKPILEETFFENDLNEMEAHNKNVLQCVNSKSQSISPETFNIKANVTFSDNFEIFPKTKVTQNDNHLIEFASPNSPKMPPISIIQEELGEICFHDKINLNENKSNSCNKTSLLVSLQSIEDATFSEEINERADLAVEKFCKSDSIEHVNSITEVQFPESPKALASTTFNEKVCIYDQVNLSENESKISNKMSPSVALQPVEDATFSEEVGDRSDQEIEKFYKSNSIEIVNGIVEVASSKSLKALESTTFNEKVEQKIYPHNKIDHTKNEYNQLQSINDTIFSVKNNKKSDVKNDNFYERDSIQNESSGELASILSPKINKCITLSNGSEVPNILEYENTSKTEFFTRSILEEDSCFEILPEPANTFTSSTFSEKTDPVQSDKDSVSNENDQNQISQNSFKEMANVTFSGKTGELISIPIGEDKYQTSPNSQKELTNALVTGLADKDINVQTELQINQCYQDSLEETTSTHLTKLCLKDTICRKATDSSSLKCCPLESKTVLKSGLIKPTQIVYPRKVSNQRNACLPIAKPLRKPIINKRSITANLNHTLNLSDNSTDKSLFKNFNRRLTLSCSSESDVKRSKCENDFKKPFGIPSKLGIKRPESNFQKSMLNTKYSNGHLKDINTVNDEQNLTKPDLISDENSKKTKSVEISSPSAKGPIPSRLCLGEKLPVKSLQMKKCGLKSNIALRYTTEKSTNKAVSCPKVISAPKKEKMPEIRIDSANSGRINSKHNIATSLPRKFLSFNSPHKTCNSRPSLSKQKSAPISNSCKPASSKPSGSLKLPNSISKLKFSSFPKPQPHIKISSVESENQNVFNKESASEIKKSNGFLIKPSVPEVQAVQFMEKQISPGHEKQKDNTWENAQPTCSMLPSSREQVIQPSKPLSVKKSNGQRNFLPMPKIIPGRSVISNDVQVTRESQHQNKVYQQTSGKLPQLRRIPAPR